MNRIWRARVRLPGGRQRLWATDRTPVRGRYEYHGRNYSDRLRSTRERNRELCDFSWGSPLISTTSQQGELSLRTHSSRWPTDCRCSPKGCGQRSDWCRLGLRQSATSSEFATPSRGRTERGCHLNVAEAHECCAGLWWAGAGQARYTVNTHFEAHVGCA